MVCAKNVGFFSLDIEGEIEKNYKKVLYEYK